MKDTVRTLLRDEARMFGYMGLRAVTQAAWLEHGQSPDFERIEGPIDPSRWVDIEDFADPTSAMDYMIDVSLEEVLRSHHKAYLKQVASRIWRCMNLLEIYAIMDELLEHDRKLEEAGLGQFDSSRVQRVDNALRGRARDLARIASHPRMRLILLGRLRTVPMQNGATVHAALKEEAERLDEQLEGRRPEYAMSAQYGAIGTPVISNPTHVQGVH